MKAVIIPIKSCSGRLRNPGLRGLKMNVLYYLTGLLFTIAGQYFSENILQSFRKRSNLSVFDHGLIKKAEKD